MLLFLSHALDFHYADSVSIAFHRRRGRGETSVHASNLIRLGEIYICYRRRISLFKVVVSLSILFPPPSSLPIPYRFTMFSSDHELVLLEFISGPVDSGATPKLPDIPRFASPIFSGYPYLFATRYTSSGQRLDGYSAMCIIGQFLGWNAPIRKSPLCLSVVLRSASARWWVFVLKITKKSLARIQCHGRLSHPVWPILN